MPKKKKKKSGKACLCKDGERYSHECCKEKSVWNQGIGSITFTPPIP